MNELRDRLSRLLNAIRTEEGLRRVEGVIQEVVRDQSVVSSNATSCESSSIKSKASTKVVFDEEDDDWEVALELCETILDSLDELPDRAEDFKISVYEKTESIREWIEHHKEVTGAQMLALSNM